ncbi:MAG TPA: M81 family metallopeptidase [Clostridiales bacterium]|jgi:microcystin degradation protein MlrC|nr:M81 family metallopeptidase [Clostridiales bacterium]
MRFLLAQFQQESNSFSPVSGTMSMFENNCLMTGEEILPYFAGTRTEMGGFIKALREINAEIIPSVAASSVSCGPVNDQVCEYVLSRIAEDIDRAGSVDCLLLCLHGAMLLESQWDGTGWFLERLRQGLKPGTLIACTLDFHANLTEKTLRNSDILVGYKTYPHIDLVETGYKAARIAVRTLRGECKPVMKMHKLPMILNSEASQTDSYPMNVMIKHANEVEEREDVISASVFQVQPWLNVKDTGCSCLVITDDSEDKAEDYSSELAGHFWELRHEFRFELTPVSYAIQKAIENKNSFPVIFADSADGTGSGSPGDSTAILSELLAGNRMLKTYLSVVDPETVVAAIETGIGNTGSFLIGGKIDRIHGKPVWVTGKVKTLSDGVFVLKGPQSTGKICDMGRTAVIQAGEIYIVVMENSVNNWDPALYRSLGLEPMDARIVVVKSPAAFRAAYADISQEACIVDTPGASSANLSSLPFDKVTRPMYPFDDFDYEVKPQTL